MYMQEEVWMESGSGEVEGKLNWKKRRWEIGQAAQVEGSVEDEVVESLGLCHEVARAWGHNKASGGGGGGD